ncbi:MAG: hypothetical protein COA63_001145 [Methylophaga sp.]|nr:hypothetical protein [Methylophaga sp.]
MHTNSSSGQFKAFKMIKLLKLSISALFFTMAISLASADDEVSPTLKEYKSTKMGFELSYPETWAISEDSETSIALRRFVKEQNRVAFISFFLQKNINPKRLPISEWYLKMLASYKKSGTKPPDSINTELGGQPVVLIKHDGNLGTSYNYYWGLNTDILSMNFHPNKDIKDDVDKIISTIKIYESN